MIGKAKNLFPLSILAFCVLGCNYLSGTGDKEVVFAPTEVGTPEGDKVTKEIGPAGGTLSSPDGRLTLTVPQNALTETLSFSIQPITNKAGNGLGLAYRLEPSGRTFTTPLEISVRYDEKDLEGTVPGAFSLAYQDEQGAWHASKSANLDENTKTLTVMASHFTDWSFIARLTLSPKNATLKVGESLVITAIQQCEETWLDKLLKRGKCSLPAGTGVWKLQGPGSLARTGDNIYYLYCTFAQTLAKRSLRPS